MQTGTYISGAGHVALIAWVLFGGILQSTDAARVPENMSVSVISSAELAALSAPQPQSSDAPATPTAPATDAAPKAPGADRPVDAPAPPAPQSEPAADTNPDVSQIEPLPQTQVVPTAPAAPPSPDTETAAQLVVKTPQPPQPRAAPRVAPKAAEAPPEDAQVSDVVKKEVVPDANAATQTPQKPEPAQAPKEAATEIVTEAEKPKAPKQSPRPKSRPAQPAPAKVAAAKPETPKPQTPKPAPKNSSTDNAVAAALAAPEPAPTPAPTPAPAAPSGPPLTGGEKDALRVAVQACWNVGSLSSDALATTVVVGVSMNRDGTPDTGSIRMLSSDGGSASATKQAFETARRAIIRCGAKGYNLPTEKYSRWQDIEMTFNPERMRIK